MVKFINNKYIITKYRKGKKKISCSKIVNNVHRVLYNKLIKIGNRKIKGKGISKLQSNGKFSGGNINNDLKKLGIKS